MHALAKSRFLPFLGVSFFCSLIFLLSCNSPDEATLQLAKTGKWEAAESQNASLPVARHEASYVKCGEVFVLLGGRGIRPVSIFDPRVGEWREGNAPPIEIHHFQAVAYQGKVWIMGALTGGYPGETPLPHVYTYDPQKDVWAKGDSIPANRLRGAAGVSLYEDKFYISCGIKDGHRGDHKKWLDEYDPATSRWRTLPDAPRTRDHFQTSIYHDSLFVAGGRRSRAPDSTMLFPVAEIDVYDFKSGKWATLPNALPTLRAGTYNAVWGNELLVLGGESPDQVPAHSEVEALNLKDYSWRSLGEMIEGRHGTGAVMHEGYMYVASGSGNRGGGPELETQERFHFPSVEREAVFLNDAVVLGILLCLLAFVFITSSSEITGFKRFYGIIPPIVLCYFLPALLNWPLNLIDPEATGLYNPVASRYLLPACLVLLCISIDFKGLIGLGSKSLIMFLTATVGIVIGGPIALFIFGKIAPGVVQVGEGEELWRGLSTIAGSWIGGGANQAAMMEINDVSERLFSAMVVVDVVVANIWMAFLLVGAGRAKKIDKWLGADSSAIDDLKERVEAYSASIARNPTTLDYFKLLAVAFGATGIAHIGKDFIAPIFQEINKASMSILNADGSMMYPNGKLVEWGLSSLMSSFFWLIVIATTIGLILSFTRARRLEGVGASKIATIFIYFLVATIGMKMNILEVYQNLGVFFVGLIWMLIHVGLLLTVARLIKAPFFFVAVGSQANVGGAASAPVVASAFSPALAPVGALMAVLGYALGTYGAIICSYLMEMVSRLL
ncbi:MAG: DUF819 family protein [Bacteroidia bacterium]